MNIFIICLIIAALLPFLSKIPLTIAQFQMQTGYDNNHPRIQQARLEGFGARALGAHKNSFESFIFFSAAVLLVLVTHHESMLTERLAVIYIISRFAYHILYLLNWAGLRSLIWAVSYFVCIFMMGVCLYS